MILSTLLVSNASSTLIFIPFLLSYGKLLEDAELEVGINNKISRALTHISDRREPPEMNK